MNNKKIIKIKETPEFWKSAILGLPEEVQATVAKIIWWDHFAGRMVSERWPHLDEWLNKPSINLTQEEWVKYLTKTGYEKNEAENRCTEQQSFSRSRGIAISCRARDGQPKLFRKALGGKV